MFTFNNPLQRIDHLEDLLLRERSAGFRKIIATFSKFSAKMSGEKIANFKINEKFDGSPSIIFGRDFDGRYFISTKSIFNKTPKINYTFSDILRNHVKSSSLLVAKLGEVLERLPQLQLKTNEIFQGDLIYTIGNRTESYNGIIVQPNLLKYTIKKCDIKHIGISIHTKYNFINNEYYQCSNVNHYKLYMSSKTSDIHIINPSYTHVPEKDTQRCYKAVSMVEYMERYNIRDLLELANRITFEKIDELAAKYGESIIKKNNECIKNKLAFIEFECDENIEDIILLYNAIAATKYILIEDLLYQGHFEYTKLNPPEGFVVTHDYYDTPIKLVNRRDFTYKNHLLHSDK